MPASPPCQKGDFLLVPHGIAYVGELQVIIVKIAYVREKGQYARCGDVCPQKR